MKNNTAKKIHKLYEESKKIIETIEIGEGITAAENKTEQDFYLLLHDFFLQQRQKEAIKDGVF